MLKHLDLIQKTSICFNMETSIKTNKSFPPIMGFNATSEAGFDRFASSIFLFGCNLRCPYCMNGRIVVVKPEDWEKPVKSIPLEVIKERILDAKAQCVMISGGEPTITPIEKLTNLIDEIISWGCRVGMSTNGTRPEIMELILPKLSHIAMDIKSADPKLYASLDIKYKEASFDRMLKTKALLAEEVKKRNDFTYEVRTTLYPTYIKEEDMHKIGALLSGEEVWVLQCFRHAKNMLDAKAAEAVKPYTMEEVSAFEEIAKQYAKKVIIRYV